MLHKHGGDIYACRMERDPDDAGGTIPDDCDEITDFSANINFRGMPQAVRLAARSAVTDCVHYPDPECRVLKTALAERENALLRRQKENRENGQKDRQMVPGQVSAACGEPRESAPQTVPERIQPEQIICGNGAAELIFALAAAYRPRRALLAVPSFFEYEQALAAFGCEIRHFALSEEQDFRLDERFADAVDEQTDCVVLGNPNNPTGRLIEGTVLRRIVERCRERKILLVLDESFYDFLCDEDREETFSGVHEIQEQLRAQKCPGLSERSGTQKRQKTQDASKKASGPVSPGIFVVRSFTKIYGMPGLRFGYGICGDPGLLDRMREVLQPWNVSLPAQAAAEQAAGELAYAQESARMNQENRGRLLRQLEEAGYRVFPSESNFLLFRGPAGLREYCLKHGFLIRDCGNFPGLGEGFYRVCVRSRGENDALMRVLAAAKREL